MTDERIERRLTALAQGLRQRGAIRSAAVERAFRSVRRDRCVTSFLDGRERVVVPQDGSIGDRLLDRIYSDVALVTHPPAGPEDATGMSSSSLPSLMAEMLEALELAPGMRVLEIGAGTGYNAALIAAITGAPVVSIDVTEAVVEEARAALRRLGAAATTVVLADGYRGHPSDRLYDRIIVTVGCAGISPHWLEQLADDGLIVAPLEHLAPIAQGGFTPIVAVRRAAGGGLLGHALVQAAFMPASGPLYRQRDGSPPRGLLRLAQREHTTHQVIAALDDDAYADLWFQLGARDRRVTRATMVGLDPAGGDAALVDDARGVAFVQKDAVRLAGDRSLLDEAAALIAEWERRGRPRIRDWTCALTPAGAADAPIFAPAGWTLIPVTSR